MMTTGLFFGSFNPIHNGHLIIAEYMRQQAELNEIWFVVSPQNPFKKFKILIDENLRLQMVKIAVKDNKYFTASNVEFTLPRPSYTVDTLRILRENYPDKKFAIILGSDNLEYLSKWKDYEAILKTYPILIYKRKDVNEFVWKPYQKIKFFDSPLIDISSTYIRQLIRKKKSVKYLVPEPVLKFIGSKHLYLGENKESV